MEKLKELSLLAQSILEKAKKRKRLSKKEIKAGFKWLKIAKDDLTACKLLYKKKKYALSVYHLQQFYEKLSKGFFILSGTANMEKLASHTYTQQELKRLYEDGWLSDVKILCKAFELKEPNMNTKEIYEINEKVNKYKNLPESEFEKIIKIFTIIEQVLFTENFIQSIYEKINEPRTFNKIKHFVQLFTHGFRVHSEDVSEQLTEKNIRKEINFFLLSIKTMPFAIATSYHEATTRYPDAIELNYFSYKHNFGLVMAIPKLIKFSERLIKEHKKYFEEADQK